MLVLEEANRELLEKVDQGDSLRVERLLHTEDVLFVAVPRVYVIFMAFLLVVSEDEVDPRGEPLADGRRLEEHPVELEEGMGVVGVGLGEGHVMDCLEVLFDAEVDEVVVAEELREIEVLWEKLLVVLGVLSDPFEIFLKREEQSISGIHTRVECDRSPTERLQPHQVSEGQHLTRIGLADEVGLLIVIKWKRGVLDLLLHMALLLIADHCSRLSQISHVQFTEVSIRLF